MIVRRTQNDELYHFGIKGQRWGVRRYQNPDGSLTAAGKERYGYSDATGKMTRAGKKLYKKETKAYKKTDKIRQETVKKIMDAKEPSDLITAMMNDEGMARELKYHDAPSLEKARLVGERMKERRSVESNWHAREKMGLDHKDPMAFVNLSDEDKVKYLKYGQKKCDEITKNEKWFKESKKEYNKLGNAGYQEAKKYFDEYLGEYGKQEATVDVGTEKIDKKTKKARNLTNSESLAYLLTRIVTDY